MKDYEKIKIATFGMLNNPEYRQEPWRESFAQKLQFFDIVCVVCGHKPDIEMLAEAFPDEFESGRLKAVYKHWSFPEWSYEELPKHLNTALSLAKDQGCDWLVKLDVDTVFHEKDIKRFRKTLWKATKKKKWIVSVQKLQFFTPYRYWRKGNLPIAISTTTPVVYGFDRTRYTDLCQPIMWDGVSHVVFNDKTHDIPTGDAVQEKYILKTRKTRVFNYDFTFRTYERSIELLYQIEMAHARFWGKGYSGLGIDQITRETSMQDFLNLSKERFSKMKKRMRIDKHPMYFQESLENITSSQWGHSLWGKIPM